MKYLTSFNFKRGYIIYPTLVVVVGVFDKNKRANFMSCVWNTALSFEPPLYGVSIAPTRATHDLILQSRSFSVCFYPFIKAQDVEFFGTRSYRDTDKSKNVNLLKSIKLEVPIPDSAYAVLECGLYDFNRYGDHTLFVGKIEVIHYDENVTYELFNMPVINLDKVKPVLYLGNGVYLTTDSNSILNLRA
ncbi:MAG: flavin reductase family protein [candidate division WOR-3 bacterium]|nr:flavin reductase family protein [candidate division WOR-3 bacterium]MCX7947850.1 flavin reductase family protein [candidate division WOR-3 bacterium]MDW8150672.1 flavin reductase family protein [candidate division WOR-3 bacterium]